MSVPADRLPPQNLEAEQSVLGSLLLDRDAIATAVELLRPEDFYEEVHQLIFQAVVRLYDQNRPVDVVTLAEELRREGHLERVGGASYLGTLARAVPTAANVRHYAEIVQAKAMLRALIKAGTRIVGWAYEDTDDPRSLVDRAEQLIFDIAQDRVRHPYTKLKALLVRAIDRLEKLYETKSRVTGVPTGFWELDEITSGLQPSDLVVLAGRPSQGKTTLAINIARHVAVRFGLPVGFFSLEMSADQVALRFLAAEGPFDAHRMRSGDLDERDFQRLAEATGRLGEALIYIDDSPALSVLELRSRARRMKRDHNAALIIIDYLQLMRGNPRAENRQQEISEISRSLKALARELDVPVLALSQLSRAVEGRPDRRPQLSDLRESGAIEQDADVVAFIHFPPDNSVCRDWKGYEYRVNRESKVLEVSKDGTSLQYDLRPETGD
ncbi:MAG: replicative DNA helicase, partial [Firmicutes bacterium]|nr:replicative DNA helicase [Bacillota bacterium]